MTDGPSEEVTTVLNEIRAGNDAAREQLAGLVYHELRRVAAALMRGEREGHTLQPTALVNEAFVRLLGQDALARTENRQHFFAAAARAMRQVLVDHARARHAERREGHRKRVPLDDLLVPFEQQNLDVVGVHEVLEQLGKLHERQAKIVELRFFGGFTLPEIAALLEVSLSLVEKDYRRAQAFLRSRLAGGS